MNISIKIRLFALGAIGVIALLVAGIVGSLNLNAVGGKVNEIAANHIPVMNKMQTVTKRQFEQSLMLKTMLRKFAQGSVSGTETATMLGNFTDKGDQIDKQLKQAETMVQKALAGESDTQLGTQDRNSFKDIRSQLTTIQDKQDALDKSATNLINTMYGGQDATDKIESVEAQRQQQEKRISDVVQQISALAGNSAKQAQKRKTQGQYMLGGIGAAALFLILVFSGLMIRSIIRPVAGMTRATEDLAADRLETTLPPMIFRDEIAAMGDALETLRDKLQKAEHMRKEREKDEQRQAEQRRREREDMADQFNSKVGEIIKQVDSAAQELQGMAKTLASAVDKTTEQSNSVASAAEEASTNVQTVASSMEEMSASIREITQNVSNTADSAKSCAQTAENSKGKLDELQKAVSEIDSVIEQINNVAEQTNMLALNATIEAARAGEAGKGFAVVANEVKSLAGQTHEMTDEISNKVDHVKSSADETISSVNDIISQIENVDEQTTTVSSAVEEQNTTIDEISRNIQEASQGTTEVAENIEGIQHAANDSSSATDKLKTSADNLAKQSQNLQNAVDSFVSEIRNG